MNTKIDNMELVSVIIPMYNSEKYISLCLESILAQTYTNIEIIVISDGSTDSSYDIVLEKKKADSRIFAYSQPQSGLSMARNLGLSKASGGWVLFVDSDDFLASNAVELLLNAAITKHCDMVCAGFYRTFAFPESLDTISQVPKKMIENTPHVFSDTHDIYAALLTPGSTFIWNKLIKKDLFDGLEFPPGKLYEDLAMFALLADRIKCLGYIAAPVYYYVQHSGSISRVRDISRQLDGLEHKIAFAEKCMNSYPDLAPIASEGVIDFTFYLLGKGYSFKVPRKNPFWVNMKENTNKYYAIAKPKGFIYKFGHILVNVSPLFAGLCFYIFSSLKNRS